MLAVTIRGLDILIIVLGAFAAHILRYGMAAEWTSIDTLLIAVSCAVALLLFPALGIYDSWRGKSLIGLMWRIVIGWLLTISLALLVMFAVHRSGVISRLWLIQWAVTAGVSLLVVRCVVHFVLRRLRRSGRNQRSVALVGSVTYTKALLARIKHAPQAGFRPLCILDEQGSSTTQIGGLPVFSDFDVLVRFVRQRLVHEIWLALPLTEEHSIVRCLHEFRNDFVNIRFLPDIHSLPLFNHSLVDVLGVPAINLAASPITDIEILPKLIFDRLFALVVLVMLSPLFFVIGLLIKCTSKGPVFFKQKRKGLDGRDFTIYKFRSMKMHAEVQGQLTQARKSDPRITRVGAFLRKSSLDELPQFINVLRGEMSVVGPRPHALEHDNFYKNLVSGYMHRYRIKPGITGWAQINGHRGETDQVEKMAARVKFDLFYIQHWSFWLDLKIVWMTMYKGFVSKNAY